MGNKNQSKGFCGGRDEKPVKINEKEYEISSEGSFDD